MAALLDIVFRLNPAIRVLIVFSISIPSKLEMDVRLLLKDAMSSPLDITALALSL